MKLYYKQGNVVEQGTFWGVSTGNRYDIVQATELVENSIKAHILLVLGLAPIIGLVFAVFLPLIGILMTGKFIAEKVFEKVSVASQFSWSPVMAYLTGKRNKKK